MAWYSVGDMSVIVKKDGKVVRHFSNLIDAGIFVGATPDDIMLAKEAGRLVNGYEVLYTH